ncbi:MAG TPA: 7-carboxy-7-deazaguanine synthase [Gemmatimonadaceae bacterium]|jgi:7-carboxy-7-deazaguanine synthase (Cx14CxxC type)|nr:7-carboxy-7-deazaguanine synthase [Gemmatimonadaceae bacterium]
MTYVVREIFYTLQGEGRNAGRPAVFCRFSGCNLWTGREQDRDDAVCRFCDTEFVGVGPDGGRFADADALADAVLSRWPHVSGGRAAGGRPLVVCTGGEPLLQLDTEAVRALHARGFEVAVETNGTQPAPPGIDHLCVSPKAGAPLVLTRGTELKLVYPQREPAAQPERFEHLAFDDFILQPMDTRDPAETRRNVRAALAYCLAHPRWRLGLQTHKLLDIR